jgi:Fur family ferric uptake transcriptional regulator
MACKEHIAGFKTQLRKNNLKATPARLNILDVFEHAKRPLSVSEISDKLESSDKATVYRNIDSLQNLGIIKQIRFQDRQAYYEINNTHHHHVICKKCGKIRDIESCKIILSGKNTLINSDFTEITDHSLEFYGICNACAR